MHIGPIWMQIPYDQSLKKAGRFVKWVCVNHHILLFYCLHTLFCESLLYGYRPSIFGQWDAWSFDHQCVCITMKCRVKLRFSTTNRLYFDALRGILTVPINYHPFKPSTGFEAWFMEHASVQGSFFKGQFDIDVWSLSILKLRKHFQCKIFIYFWIIESCAFLC